VQNSLKFTVGMPVFDDFTGVWLTVQALRLYFHEWIGEILVIDNNPSDVEGSHGKTTRDFCNSCPGVRYVPFPSPKGPALAKQQVFENARFEHVACFDSHIMVTPGAFAAFERYYLANPGSKNLLHGPLINDNFISLATHFEDVWPVDEVVLEDPVTKVKTTTKKPSQMWGRWGRDLNAFPLMPWETSNEVIEKVHPETQQVYLAPRHEPELPRPAVPWFEIPAQGMGMFVCRKDAFVGFNPRFIGFGGEEWYIHEKTRKAGNKVVCVSGAMWSHRFARPDGIKHPVTLWHKYRNYEIGLAELGIDPSRLREHFVGHGLVPESWIAAALRGDAEQPATVIVAPNFIADGTVVVTEAKQAAAEPEVPCVPKTPCWERAQKAKAPLADGDTIEVEYARVCAEPGDINEHLPTIRGLVEAVGPTCRVVELGSRNGVTTTALMAGGPASILCVDTSPGPGATKLQKYQRKYFPRMRYEVRQGHTEKAEPEDCDVLVVDSDPHTLDHVTDELERHAGRCRRFIVFHDTQIYGEHYGNQPGIMPAIRKWLAAHPEWTMIRRDKNNNGLSVISRDDRDKQMPPKKWVKALNFGRALIRHGLDGAVPTSETEMNRRLELCVLCPKRNVDICGACGCPLTTKSSWRSEDCPIGNWKADEDAGGTDEKQPNPRGES